MNAFHAAPRRHLSSSPFKVPDAAPPPEQYAVNDQVTHDKYGLGRVTAVEGSVAVVVDFGSHRRRLTTPCAKLTKL